MDFPKHIKQINCTTSNEFVTKNYLLYIWKSNRGFLTHRKATRWY